MRYYEFNPSNLAEANRFQKIAATAAMAGSMMGAGIGAATRTNSFIPSQNTTQIQADTALTTAGQNIIASLPAPIRNKLGNVNTIVFASGIPAGGKANAVCQVAQGERVIWVNPAYRNQFLSGAADQLASHELTHIAQTAMSSSMQKQFPTSATNDANEYGGMEKADAWQKLAALRAKGDRMWNHSREEQGMIVQQRQAQAHGLQKILQSGRKDQATQQVIHDAQRKIAIYDQYINDYNS